MGGEMVWSRKIVRQLRMGWQLQRDCSPTADCARTAVRAAPSEFVRFMCMVYRSMVETFISAGFDRLQRAVGSSVGHDSGALVSETSERKCLSDLQDLWAVYLIFQERI